jgi:hypothetical protein
VSAKGVSDERGVGKPTGVLAAITPLLQAPALEVGSMLDAVVMDRSPRTRRYVSRRQVKSDS